uniref:Aminoacetone oxidase family FAD-binding enzyme n=1 Tax=Eiseniibacteriota bacterium TaxID=2212470 RepID=A0A832I6Y7_UNCEI
MTRRVAVVGAGAAGLTAAIRAAEAGAQVTLLNAHPRIGLKILMSGGTRCNVTHREVTERDFHGGSRAVIRRVLAEFPVAETLAWFRELGVELKLEESGKYFPATDDARTVLDALLGACEGRGVDVLAGARVVRIGLDEGVGKAGGTGGGGTGRGARPEEGSTRSRAERQRIATAPGAAATRFRLGIQRVGDSAAFGAGVAAVGRAAWPLPPVEPDEWIEADAVVLATGGLSFPRTGSDGTGYALAAALGHTLVPPTPALTPLAAADPWCAKLQGLACEAELSLWVDGRRAAEAGGALLFAHFGYTGPAALDLSRHWHAAEGRARRVIASFVPGETREALEESWIGRARAARRTVQRWLMARVPERLAEALCAAAAVDGARALNQVPREARGRLLALLTGRELPVTGTLGYEKAEVTAGGVPLAEVDPRTLESRIAPGLHLCGEVLDVEGRLGGFNFQWAWSSGTVAGRAAGKSDEGASR